MDPNDWWYPLRGKYFFSFFIFGTRVFRLFPRLSFLLRNDIIYYLCIHVWLLTWRAIFLANMFMLHSIIRCCILPLFLLIYSVWQRGEIERKELQGISDPVLCCAGNVGAWVVLYVECAVLVMSFQRTVNMFVITLFIRVLPQPIINITLLLTFTVIFKYFLLYFSHTWILNIQNFT